MEAPRHYSSHIDTSGRYAVISGTVITVAQIASETEELGMSPSEIVAAHPHIRLAEVHSALSHYYDHREAIHREWLETRALLAKLEAKYPNPTWLSTERR